MRALLVLALLALGACAQRGALTLAPEGAALALVERVYVGSTRAQIEDGLYGDARSERLGFARFDVSIPPLGKEGEILWPPRHGRADPARHFLTKGVRHFPDGAAFSADLRRDLAASGGQATVFVHGYNYNFAESLYRVAQFGHDLDLPGVMVEYAWPSAGSAMAYMQDRDSVLFARNGLESLLDSLRDAGARQIVLVAHSMGTSLAMEALRQAAIRGDRALLDRVSGVILVSPDLDVDLFHSMAEDIAPLPQPFLIFGSDRDRILRLSALLTGQPERLGSLTDMSRIKDLKVTFLDVGEFASGAGHFPVGDNPALIGLLRQIGKIDGAFERDRARQIGLLPGAVLTVQNATRIVLNPIAKVSTGQ